LTKKTQKQLGNIFGHFFTSAPGHPDCNSTKLLENNEGPILGHAYQACARILIDGK
jgi:hypothetical protein